MGHLPSEIQRFIVRTGLRMLMIWHREAGRLAPRVGRPSWPALALVWVGLVLQLVLLILVGQLVDICISIAELWLDLAQKHLEITL